MKKRLRAEGVFDPEIVCYSFDHAVVWAGHYVENKLTKYDKDKHGAFEDYFESLFAPRPEGGLDVVRKLAGMFGVIEVKEGGAHDDE